jgi:hypothetical protein
MRSASEWVAYDTANKDHIAYLRDVNLLLALGTESFPPLGPEGGTCKRAEHAAVWGCDTNALLSQTSSKRSLLSTRSWPVQSHRALGQEGRRCDTLPTLFA